MNGERKEKDPEGSTGPKPTGPKNPGPKPTGNRSEFVQLSRSV